MYTAPGAVIGCRISHLIHSLFHILSLYFWLVMVQWLWCNGHISTLISINSSVGNHWLLSWCAVCVFIINMISSHIPRPYWSVMKWKWRSWWQISGLKLLRKAALLKSFPLTIKDTWTTMMITVLLFYYCESAASCLTTPPCNDFRCSLFRGGSK